MKNKKTLIAAVVVLLVVLVGGLLVVRGSNKSQPVASPTPKNLDLPDVDPAVAVDLKAAKDNRSVVLTVSNIPPGTETIEYELSYLTGEGLPKGALGKISLGGESEVERDILFGTCSRNTCTYDTGVTSVKLVLVFNHPDGDSKFVKNYPLE